MGKYFTFEEFIKSDTAERLGIDNEPKSETVINNIFNVMEVMDLIREEWTVYCNENNLLHPQIIVNSGYRSEPLNKAIKGSPTSNHKKGTAVDFRAKNWDNKALWEVVLYTLKKYNIEWNQLIDECRLTWIHLDIGGNKKEIKYMK